MGEKKLKDLTDLGIVIHDDHPLPKSRRDFLKTGLMSLAACAMAPTLLSLAPSQLLAQDLTGENFGIPFLTLEGAGGMNIAGGNVIVGMSPTQEQLDFGGNSEMGDYILLGLPPAMHPSKTGMVNTDYGIAFHANSGILAGMNEVLTPDLRDAVDGIIICARTDDDSANNPINAAFQIQKAGSKGKLVQLIGNTNSINGTRSATIATQIKGELRATRVTNFSEGSSLLSIGTDAMGANFLDVSSAKGQARVKSFLNSILGLSKVGMDKFVNYKQEAMAISNAQLSSKEMFLKFSPNSLNPKNDPAKLAMIQSAFGGTGVNVTDEAVASVANLITDRIAGVASLQIGGCDYHAGNASVGITKDKEIGRYIGKCIKLASLKAQNIFIHLYTDGGVAGDSGGVTDDSLIGGGRVNWVTDRGTSSCQLLIVYKHNHKRSINGSLILEGRTRQVGHFSKSAAVNLSFNSVSNSPDNIWKAVVVNYLACMSIEPPDKIIEDVKTKFKSLFPSESIPTDLADLIRFKSLVA